MARRLTAILYYDAVNFSLAMGRDEARTLEGLKSDRRWADHQADGRWCAG
jgi:hypothetical protein